MVKWGRLMSGSCFKKVVCDSPLFVDVNIESFRDLFTRTITRVYEKGEVIAREGKPCNSIGIITLGSVAVQKISCSGEFATIALLSVGDFFGEDMLYSSSSVFTTTLEATSRTEVLYVSKDIMNEMMLKCPSVKDNFLRILSDRLKAQNRRIELLSQKTLREKIAYYLIDLFNEQSLKKSETIPPSCRNCDEFATEMCKYPSEARKVILPVSKEIVAKFLAMPRPSFSRELMSMEKEGLIKVEGRTIILCDVSRLEREIVEGLAANN